MTVMMTEVLGRSEQGMTRPFICRGENGCIYYVKGLGAGRRSQVCEWIGGRLGQALGLPIPPFSIVEIPSELIDLGVQSDLHELGVGPAFGSERHILMELPYSEVDRVPAESQLGVLAFDWWIRNGDRCLSALGGNPNLFWDPTVQQLLVFDHNQAFEDTFAPADFVRFHAFAARIPELFDDIVRRDAWARRMDSVLGTWDEIIAEIPLDWYFVDPEHTVPAAFDLTSALSLLRRCTRDDFWKLP